MKIKPMTKGEQTRERLLQIAENAVLHKGFAATSIEEIITEADITKSGFFYHFKDKNDLAKSLLQRYIEHEHGLFDELFSEADALHEDPLHGFLIFLKMLADRLSDLPNGHPGCLVASYCYQDQLFSRDVRDLNKNALQAWRARFRDRLDVIAERYPPKIDIDLDNLADMLSATADGGIILSKTMHDPSLLPKQVMLYRAFVRLVFLSA